MRIYCGEENYEILSTCDDVLHSRFAAMNGVNMQIAEKQCAAFSSKHL